MKNAKNQYLDHARTCLGGVQNVVGSKICGVKFLATNILGVKFLGVAKAEPSVCTMGKQMSFF